MPFRRREAPFGGVLALLIAISVLGQVAAQEEETQPPAELHVLLEALASTDWKVRDDATRELLALGPSIAPRLKELREALPLEARLRIETILDELEGPRRSINVPFEATRVNLEMVDVPLHAAATRLGIAGGHGIRSVLFAHNPRSAPQPNASPRPLSARWERPISLHFTETPFFQALDHLCQRAGLTFHRDYQTGDILLSEGAFDSGLVRYAGPLRIALTSLSITRQTRFSGAPATTASIQIRVDVEDRAPCLGLLQPLTAPASRDDLDREVKFHQPNLVSRHLGQIDKRRQNYLSATFEPPERNAHWLKDLALGFDVLVPAETIVVEAFVTGPVPWDAPGRHEGPIELRIDSYEAGPPRVLTLSFINFRPEGVIGLPSPPQVEEIEVLDHGGHVIAPLNVGQTKSESRDVRALTLPDDASVFAVRVRLLSRCRIERVQVVFERVDLP